MASPSPVVAALASPGMDPLLWPSRRPLHDSAWHGHVSFAHWLVHACAPRMIVELGTQAGVSYAAFCHAVKVLGLPTRCFAVDTWQGDAHTGRYSDAIYEDIRTFNDAHHAGFSTLLRTTFDEALPSFGDGTIDILHIDGLHTYEAVRHDFETWRPKLSDRAVVLMHDTAVKVGDFGVWRLWDELITRFPNFAFEHSAGLGVLAVGPACPPAVRQLCAISDVDEAARMREHFARFAAIARATAANEREIVRLRGVVATMKETMAQAAQSLTAASA